MRCYGIHFSTLTVLVWILSSVSYGVAAVTNSNTADELDGVIQQYVGTPHPLFHDGLVRWFKEYPPPPTTISGKDTIPVLIVLHYGAGNMRSSNVLGRLLEKDPWLLLAKQ